MAELTDAQLLKLARDQYKRLRDACVLGDIPDDGTGRTVYDFDLLAYGRAAIAAAKATATPKVGMEELTDGELRSFLIEAGLKEAQDFTGPEWCALSREERRTYEEWGCFEDRVMVAMRAGIAADRAARGGVALQAFIESQRPLDPEVAAALTPETLWDMYEESPDSAACSGSAIAAAAMATVERITAQREEILTAFVAKHGFDPGNAVQVTQAHADGRTTWHLERRPQPTAEALQAAYVEWFKANQGIPPSPTAARTAAQFTLAVLLGEVEL